MKYSVRFRRHAVRLSLISACLFATCGCFSMHGLSSSMPSSYAGIPAGPPAWDDTTESMFDVDVPEVAAVDDDAATNPETTAASSSTESDAAESGAASEEVPDSASQNSQPTRVAQRDDGQRQGKLGRVASRVPMPKIVEAPAEFRWKAAAKSAGDRDIESAVIGLGGYRTLLIGSLVGNDPVAVKLTERLAKHVHENQIVLGGIQLSVIRNLNPDGEVNGASETEDRVYLNRQMSQENVQAADLSGLPVELKYLFGVLEDGQPQRVIHVRTVGREQGIVAYSSGAKNVADDIAKWTGFQQMELPGRSAEGTLERYLSESEQCEIVTFAFPESVSVEEAWELYSDALMNLLMDEDFATRKLARQQKSSKAADRRGRND